MPAEILRQRMDDDIRAMLERAQQVGRRHRVVDDERQAVAVRDLGERGDIGDVAERIADRFREDRLRPCVDQRVERGRLARVGEARRDSVLRQRMREQVVGAAVQRARRYDVVARLRDRQDRISDGRLARCERERADAAFERRDALLEHVVGRIHDPRIDVALDLQIEQVRAVLRVVERERDRLIDRHRGGARRRIGAIAAVHGEGLEAPVGGCGFGHDGSPVDLLVGRFARVEVSADYRSRARALLACLVTSLFSSKTDAGVARRGEGDRGPRRACMRIRRRHIRRRMRAFAARAGGSAACRRVRSRRRARQPSSRTAKFSSTPLPAGSSKNNWCWRVSGTSALEYRMPKRCRRASVPGRSSHENAT
ncbi:hypothetical protein BO07_5022 [Burkholderia mallei]|nr:hypothetical protein BO07_5022 [Burkholderia mallei]